MSADQPATTRLDPDAQRRVDEWYRAHGEEVVNEVRRWLRKRTAPVASISHVAQSVWASFIESHLSAADAEGPLPVLVRAAHRHCEKHNRRQQRHPSPSLDAGDGFDPEGLNELGPEAQAVLRETATLFQVLSQPDAHDATRALAAAGQGIGLVEILAPLERIVLGLKMVGRTRPEIASEVRLDEREVDAIWKSVKEKGQLLAAAL
jgi:DNA-directed RNA polymerase specialized sigma24 family protein